MTITPYRDGPYIIRGDFTITDQDGNVIDARRKTVALCRCGKSQIRPFCDGTHKLIGFEAAGGPEGDRPASGQFEDGDVPAASGDNGNGSQ